MNRAEVLDHGTRVCTAPGAGFGTATNLLTLISPDETVELPLMDKQQAAHVLLDHILSLRDQKPRP